MQSGSDPASVNDHLSPRQTAEDAFEALRSTLAGSPDADWRRLDAVLEQLPVGVLIAEADTRQVVAGNAKVASILGIRIPYGQDIIQSIQGRAWHPDGRPLEASEFPLARAVNAGESVANQELLCERPDGSRVWINSSAGVLRDPKGAIRAGVVAFLDITAERQARQLLQQRTDELTRIGEELQSTVTELEAFSYTVSHDLRAPFRHIVGFGQLLKDTSWEQLNDDGRRYLATMLDSAAYAGKLVDSLLSYAHLGRAALKRERVDMNKLVEQVRSELDAESADRTIEWDIDQLPQVNADPMMMRLLWHNLLSNAVKYTRPRDPATIEVGSGDGEREFIFFVRDNGVGFDMKYAQKLFGVFQRLHRADEFEGTGIGLAHVRRIVSRHGGRTWVNAEVDKGATFYFSLPKD